MTVEIRGRMPMGCCARYGTAPRMIKDKACAYKQRIGVRVSIDAKRNAAREAAK